MTAAQASQPIALSYQSRSDVVAAADGASMLLALDAGRGTVGVHGRVRDAALLRDAMLALIAVLESDLRYKGKDRSAYLAYLMKQGKKANAAIWEAQKAFLDAQLSDDRKVDSQLDPVLTVDPDQVSLEVFSRDESAYARLALANELFEDRGAAHGTAFVDLGAGLVDRLERLATHGAVSLDASSARVGKGDPLHRAVEIPHSWLRGFLQVQSAATLPAATCELAPIDLYNLLFALRTRKAKNPPRGLRFELVPGLAPRLVIEPFELVLECHGPPYQGSSPRVVRTFGRQRLLSLARALPYLQRVRVQLLGPGLPVFWMLDLGLAQLTVALSGWVESSWASAATFDQLMPAGERGAALSADVLSALRREGPRTFDELLAQTGASREELRAATQRACLRGEALFDIATQRFRPRSFLAQAVPEAAVRFASPREAYAHRLLGDGAQTPSGEVHVAKVHEIAGEGVEIVGDVNDKEARRSYAPRFKIDLEGRVYDASCTCATYQRSGLREGPCEHMIALRLAYARKVAEAEALRNTPEGRKTIRAETRTYVRRTGGVETVYRVSLDDKVVRLEWGQRTGKSRHQQLWFDTDMAAKEAYFTRLEALLAEGFVDAEASAG